MDALLNNRIVIGYHGCDRSIAEEVILQNTGLEKSRNKYDWLGEGIYFWEHGPQRALDWAIEQKRRAEKAGRTDGVKDPYVLGAYISLGACFDLLDSEHTDQLQIFYDNFVGDLESIGITDLPENKSAYPNDHDLLLRKLDCAVINHGLNFLDEKNNNTYSQPFTHNI